MADEYAVLRGTTTDLFKLGVQGPQIKKAEADDSAMSVRNKDDSGFSVMRAADPSGLDDLSTRRFTERMNVDVAAQVDTSGGLPNNTAAERYLLVTTAGSGAVIGDLLYDNGLNDALPMTIVPAVNGRMAYIPTAFAGGTITLDGSSVYIWDAAGGAWDKIADVGSVADAEMLIRFTVGTAAQTDSSAQIPAGYRVLKARFEVTTPYSAGGTVSLGDTTTPALFMATTDNDAQTAGAYNKTQDTNVPALSAVRATVGGAPGAGAGVALVWYGNPSA